MDLNGLTLFVLLSLVIGVTCQNGEDCCMNELCPYYCVRCDGTSQCFDLSDELGCSSKGDIQLQSYVKPPVFVPLVLKTLKAQLQREKQSVASLFPHRQCLPQLKPGGPATAATAEPVWLQLMNKLQADAQTTTPTTTITMAVPTTVDPPWFNLLKSLIEEVKINTTTTFAPIVSNIPTLPTTTPISIPVSTVVSTPPITKVVSTPPITKVVSTPPITKVVSTPPITKVVSTPPITKVVSTPPITKVVSTPPITKVVSTRNTSIVTQTTTEDAMINPSTNSIIDRTNEENLTANAYERVKGIPIKTNYDTINQRWLFNYTKNTKIETNFTLSSNVTNESKTTEFGHAVIYDQMNNPKSIQQRENKTMYTDRNSPMFVETIEKTKVHGNVTLDYFENSNSSIGVTAAMDSIKPKHTNAFLNLNNSNVLITPSYTRGYVTDLQNTSLPINDSVASTIPDSKDAANILHTGIENITLSSVALESETPFSQSDITATESEINLLLSGLRKTLHKTKERMTSMTDQHSAKDMSAQATPNQTDNQISMVKYGLLTDFQTNTDVSNTSRNESTGIETALTDIIDSRIEMETVKHEESGPRVKSTSSWKVKPTTFPFDNFLYTFTSQAPLSDTILRTIPSKTIWSMNMDEPMSEIQSALSSNKITNISKTGSGVVNTISRQSSTNETSDVLSNSTNLINDTSFRLNMMKSNEGMKAERKSYNINTIAPESRSANVRSSVPSTPHVISAPSTPQSVTRLQQIKTVPLTLQQNRPKVSSMVQTVVTGNLHSANYGKNTPGKTETINVVTQLPITLTESEVNILRKEARKTLNESKSRIAGIEGKLSSMDMLRESKSTYRTDAIRQPAKSNIFKYGLLTDFQINEPLANFTVNRSLGIKPILQEAIDGKTVKTITQKKIGSPNNAQSIVTPLPWMFQTTSFPFDSIWNVMSTQSSLLDSMWNPMPTNTLWGSFLDNWNIGSMGLSTTAKSQIFYQERFPATAEPTLTTTSTPFVSNAAPSSNSDTILRINPPIANSFKDASKTSEQLRTSQPHSIDPVQTVKPYIVLEAETKPILASKTLYEGELVPTEMPTFSATFGQNNYLNGTPFSSIAKLSVPNEATNALQNERNITSINAGNQVYNFTTGPDESNINITTPSNLFGNQNTSMDLYDNVFNKSTLPEFGSIRTQIEKELLTRNNSLQGSIFTPPSEMPKTDASQHVTQTTISNTDASTHFTQTASSISNSSMQVTQTASSISNSSMQVTQTASLISNSSMQTTQTASSISNSSTQVTQTASSITEAYAPVSHNANSNADVSNLFTQTASSKFDPSTYVSQTASPTTEGFTIVSKTSSSQSIPSAIVPSAKPVKRIYDATIKIVKAHTDQTTDDSMFVNKFPTQSNKIHLIKPTDTFSKSKAIHTGSGDNLKPTITDKKKANWWNTEFQPTTYFPIGNRFRTSTQEPWNTANRRLTKKDDGIQTTTISSRSSCMHIQDSSAFCNDLNAGQYKNPDDCTTYFVCDWGDLYRCYCPPNTLFDSKLRVCNWDYAVTC